MASQASSASAQPAFELKGRMTTISILRVLTTDMERLLADLDRRLAEAPGFFTGMPVALDLEPVREAGVAVPWLSELAHHLWQQELAPMAVVAGDPRIEDTGREAGLGAIRLPGGGEKRRKPRQKDDDAGAEPAAGSSRVVTQPVRSGQQIYARGDLVVLAPVSPGAELLADGHIHVYASLRGRALAGVQGDTGARIFCHHLNAELIAIAGHYQVSEHLEEAHRGRSVQIHLSGEALCIEPLGSSNGT